MKKILYSFMFLLLFFTILIPTSDKSDMEDFGKLIQNHINTAIEFQESYITLLAISTVNHDNEIGDKFNPFESVFYVRELLKKQYKLETYTVTNSAGETEERTRKKLIKTTRYYGKEFINFFLNYYEVTEEKLFNLKEAKEVLKFKTTLSDETLPNGDTIEYEVVRVFDLEELYPEDSFKRDWFNFLVLEKGIEYVYGGENFLEDVVGGVDGYAPFDPEKEDIVEFAKRYIGRPYSWGAAFGDTTRFDCSSYTMWIYNQVLGTNIPRNSYAQFNHLNRVSTTSQLETGDLVFFYTGYGNVRDPITHVGMYIGDGKFIHASSDGVMISNFDKYWSKAFRGGGRP